MNDDIGSSAGSLRPTPVQPFRLYEAIHVPGGPLLGFMLRRGGYPTPDWAALLEEGDRITREEIRSWLGTISCTDSDLNLLYEDINLVRVTVVPRQALPKSYPFNQVREALKTLERDLPSLIAELHGIQNEFATRQVQRDRNDELLAEANRFSEAVARMRVHVPDDISAIHHKFQEWHDDAL